MVRPTLAHYVCAISLLAASPAVVLAQAQKYEGKQILTIQFDPKEQPLEASELHDILPLQKDQPLRMADVRASIERLFAGWSGHRQFLAKDSVSEVIMTR